ncbi:MAG: DUF2339 domain-containing protein [Acidobacteria bacterium]|nr:DUF2339 domain-containing protein [Acidobacteriota bacterium]
MITAILMLAIIVLAYKIYRSSRRLNDFDTRFGLLERQLHYLEQKLNEIHSVPKPPQEPAAARPAQAEPAPAVKPPAVKPVAPMPPPRKVEVQPAPAVQAAPSETPPPKPYIPPPPGPPSPPPPPAWKMPKFDWESLVGVKLFSWIAGVALLLAAIFFLRYSISQGWLMPEVRLVIGIIVGLGLLILCELRAARKYPTTANAMDASAIAILFATFFAAHSRWNLIGPLPAFGLMVLVAAVAVLLSIRRDSIFIALLGLAGGFATPALLSTGDRPVPLFLYILLLNAGLAWVAARKKWPLLTTLSLIFTVIYQWRWVMQFLSADQLPVAIGIFLVFPILAFVSLALGRKEEPEKGLLSLYGQTSNLTALLPLLFALYLAAVPGYGYHYALLFGFLFLLDVGFFAIAVARGPEILHFAGGLSTIVVCAIWFGMSYDGHAWPAVLAFIILFAAFYLAAPSVARYFGRSFTGTGRNAVYAAPLLLFALPYLVAIEPACHNPVLLFGSLFIILLGASVYAISAEEGPVYFIGAAAGLLAEAVWSVKYLTPERLYSGLALYVIFGLFYVGVPMAAQRWKKKLRPESAGAGLLLVSLALLLFLVAGPIASVSIWGIALLLLILNAGLFWQGAACRLPIFAIGGMVFSWIILGILWASVSLAAILMPALVVMAGFALLVLAGNIWMKEKTGGDKPGILDKGVFLGLAGHVFLVAIAAHRSLSDPPWPLLGILLVLDLAIGAAALYLRRNDLHRAAMAATAFILIVWVSVAGIAPFPTIAILSAMVMALFGFVWMLLAKRAGIDSVPFTGTAAITVILAQIVTIFAAVQPGAPKVGFLLAVHLIFLIALMALDWVRRDYMFAAIGLLPSAAAVSLWFDQHQGSEFWPQQLLFAIPIYLIFICYPLLLGKRCGKSPVPYATAVLAGIPFFFQARHAMIQAGLGGAIGILPVAQALLMAVLLMRLLKIEPHGERSLGRLALVAGAALAFITVAIPLQLEKEWITIGWALEGMALAWLYGKIPHKGLLYFSSALFAAAFVRLALNPSVFTYQARSGIRIWNWYLYTYLVSAASMIAGGWLLSKTRDEALLPSLRISKLLPVGGTILLFLLLNIEIADFYSTGTTIAFKFTATLAQDLTYTLGWALFAMALLAAGIVLRNQPARIASLALLVITIFKCFFHDLARLGGLYRVASFVGLAISLILVALVLQKFVLSARKEER